MLEGQARSQDGRYHEPSTRLNTQTVSSYSDHSIRNTDVFADLEEIVFRVSLRKHDVRNTLCSNPPSKYRG